MARLALHQQGNPETGPWLSALEDGMMHFHAFLRKSSFNNAFFRIPQRAAHTAHFFAYPR
ncbi:hypothetical protein ABW22_12860 [Thiobacillus denitrificans]|uniref:Uncharacterized protein n=1 Tax=Thiobacillus denitrificans TaxID=36861 RepID=A0A106BLC5_THIDE|nr:hypothetical protein ABW22_12860 [Thiobacillus denitrificans]